MKVERDSNESVKRPQKLSNAVIDDLISKSKTLSELLTVAGKNQLHPNQAMRIVSILSEWEQNDRVKLTDFEKDPRFLALCRILGQETNVNKQPQTTDKSTAFQTEDMNLVMGVAGDDEAAKMVACISLQQMVTVMSALSQRKRRSTPMLRSLAYHISNSSTTLNLKQCADVLFSMATLNFSDTVLVARISVDVQSELPKYSGRPAAVGSIITSLGLLKHRDTGEQCYFIFQDPVSV